jgi:hypothetical protein
MPYSIVILESASNQLAEIYKYIKYNLESPLAAINTIDKIEKAINDLNVFPNRFPLYKGKLKNKNKLRLMPLDNFNVYYSVNENDFYVYVHYIIYSKRNIDNIID